MSQKVRIDGVRHDGASVFLGVDHCGNPCWTRNPERVMEWLCDGCRKDLQASPMRPEGIRWRKRRNHAGTTAKRQYPGLGCRRLAKAGADMKEHRRRPS